MKLKTKFAILLVGSTGIPIAMALVIWGFSSQDIRLFGSIAEDLSTINSPQGEPETGESAERQFKLTALTLPLLPPLLLFAFTIGMTSVILRGINRSIKRLEDGTRRIACGDLNFSLISAQADDLASLSAAFDAMRLRLKQEEERRNRFIMSVSHDLKTPLSVISGYVGALQDGLAETPEKSARYLEIIQEKSRLLSWRIGQLIEMAKISTAEWRHTLVPHDLKDMLEELSIIFAEETELGDYALEKDIGIPQGLIVVANRDLVHRTLENLISNAAAYSEGKKTVGLKAARLPDGEVIISVSNRGAGIQAENLGTVFEPFFRENRGRNEGGFGLGLASVKSIIDTHGWSISVESTPGGLTVFAIHIPKFLVSAG